MKLPPHCRFCDELLSQIFIDLGSMPLANSFLKLETISKEKFYPLRVFVCNKCFLVQLEEYESPEKIFSDYAYFSSYSETWLKHAKEYVDMMINKFHFNSRSLIIEVASNDGYLLQYFKEKNISVLGIEPAVNIAKVAEEKNIPTLVKFFGSRTAKELTDLGKQPDLLLGNNVLAHVPDLNDFMLGLKILLKPNGIITMEFPHLMKLIEHTQFDTIYHEHFSYFSLFTVNSIFLYHGLTIFDVEEISTHGGSLRIYARHEGNKSIKVDSKVIQLIEKEKEIGLTSISTYQNFSQRVKIIRNNLREFLLEAKKQNKKIIGYGAAAKGNTLLNYCNIGPELVEYVVDKNPHKQELYLPGTHIPIKPIEAVEETKPDYLLILPWNLKEEIMLQMDYIRKWGAKFVIPVPEVRVYS